MGFRVRTLHPDDPPDSFPDPAGAGVALGYPDGLIATGGDLSSNRLLAAYRRGIFPWFNEDQPVLWWSPDPRAVIHPDSFHVSRSLQKELRKGHWSFSVNQAFTATIDGCAADRGGHGTWITPDMRDAFVRLHELGYAHSIESWHDGKPGGGLYGVRLGRLFFAESMYTRITNGSKIALYSLIRLAQPTGIELIDCQLESPHLVTLGMKTMPRERFLDNLAELTAGAGPLKDWRQPPLACS